MENTIQLPVDRTLGIRLLTMLRKIYPEYSKQGTHEYDEFERMCVDACSITRMAASSNNKEDQEYFENLVPGFRNPEEIVYYACGNTTTFHNYLVKINALRVKRDGYGWFTNKEWDRYCGAMAEYYANNKWTGD